jgi:hypothetical protein
LVCIGQIATDTRPAKRAVRIPWQKGQCPVEVALVAHEDLETAALAAHQFDVRVIVEALAAGEPGFGRFPPMNTWCRLIG